MTFEAGHLPPVEWGFEDGQMRNIPAGTVYTELGRNGEHLMIINLQDTGGRKYNISVSATPKLSFEQKQLELKKAKELELKRERLDLKMKKAENNIRRAVQQHMALQPLKTFVDGKRLVKAGASLSTNLQPTTFEKKHACSVCLSYTGKSSVIGCKTCGVYVHPDCYGVDQETADSDVDSAGLKNGDPAAGGGWECLSCSLQVQPKDLKCAICFKTFGQSGRGAFKRSTCASYNWVHASCALYIDETAFLDTKNMDLVGTHDEFGQFGKIANIHQERFVTIESRTSRPLNSVNDSSAVREQNATDTLETHSNCCEICSISEGVKLRCSVVGCMRRFHTICLSSGGYRNLTFPVFKRGQVSMQALCQYHTSLAYAETNKLIDKPNEQFVHSGRTRGTEDRRGGFGEGESHGRGGRSKYSTPPSRQGGQGRRRVVKPSKIIVADHGAGSVGYEANKRTFHKALKLFHETNGNDKLMEKMPVLAHQDLDLYNFFVLVIACGGCDRVVENEGTWSTIFKALPNYSKTETSASYRLKKVYMKYLYEFEKHYKLNTAYSNVLKDVSLPVENEVEDSDFASDGSDSEEESESEDDSDESESGEEDEEDSDDEFSGSEEGSTANDSNSDHGGTTKVGVKRVSASDLTRRVSKRQKGGRRS